MTASIQAPARQDDTCRAGRPACNPDTLRQPCEDCGRPMHYGRPRGAPRTPCAESHPPHMAHGLCTSCHSKRRDKTRQMPPPVEVVAESGGLDWQTDAACAGADSERFFPDGQARDTAEHAAWRFCHSCPVKDACGEFADRTQAVGIWGGTLRYWGAGRYERAALLDEHPPAPKTGGKPRRGLASRLDPLIVDLLADGRIPARQAAPKERVAVVTRLTEQGLSAADIARRIGVNERSVVRIRGRAS